PDTLVRQHTDKRVSFLKTGLDSMVAVVQRPAEAAQPLDRGHGELPDAREDATEVGLTLGNIPSANHGGESINAQASYEEAITRMLLNDYSQLAVMTSHRSTPRAVTWQ